MADNILTLNNKKYDLLKADEEQRKELIEKINLATLAQSNLANHKNDAAIQATALQVFTKQLETLVTDNMLITEEAENKDQQN